MLILPLYSESLFKECMKKRILTASSTALIINTEGDTDSCSYNKIINTKDKR